MYNDRMYMKLVSLSKKLSLYIFYYLFAVGYALIFVFFYLNSKNKSEINLDLFLTFYFFISLFLYLLLFRSISLFRASLQSSIVFAVLCLIGIITYVVAAQIEVFATARFFCEPHYMPFVKCVLPSGIYIIFLFLSFINLFISIVAIASSIIFLLVGIITKLYAYLSHRSRI